jgi:hypothetical protein
MTLPRSDWRIWTQGHTCPDNKQPTKQSASCPRLNLSDHWNLVTVDFIGGDGAEGSIHYLGDDAVG